MTRDLTARERILCAIDAGELEAAQALVGKLKDEQGQSLVGGIKLGLEFFSAQGPAGVHALGRGGVPLFLDLKFHDIPNTVAGAVRSAMSVDPAFLTIHASGGPAMIAAAAQAMQESAERETHPRPVLLAVTVLTSMDADDLAAVGQDSDVASQVRRLGEMAIRAGATGLVCAPFEVGFLREALGDDAVLVVPGVRPSWSAKNDQKRVMTPVEAVGHGADYLVIGRPITASEDPAVSVARIVAEIEGG
jgi:orotidine-5'-phosphate decarboxylase